MIKNIWSLRTIKIPLQAPTKNIFSLSLFLPGYSIAQTSSWTKSNLYFPRNMSLKTYKCQNKKSFLGTSGRSSFRCKEQKQQSFQEMVRHKLKAIDGELDRTNRASLQGEMKHLIIEVFKKQCNFFLITDLSGF